ADRAHGGRRRRGEEGAGDRPLGPRSTSAAAGTRGGGPGVERIATGASADRGGISAGEPGGRPGDPPRRRFLGGGAPGGVAERSAAAGKTGRQGRRRRSGQRSGARPAGLGSGADAV